MPSWTFGRSPDCDVVLKDTKLSNRHCQLVRRGGELWLEDLQSYRGTYVNGRKISEPTRVTPSDRIVLGGIVALPWPDDALAKTEPPERAMTVQAGGDGGEVTIGRDPESDVVLQEPGVSWNHAKLVVHGDGRGTLEDIGSSNGTFANSAKNRIERAEISRSDTVFFGTHRVPASELFDAAKSSPPPPPEPERSVELTVDRPLVVGRDPACDRVLDHPLVSWRHAKITRRADGFVVEDLGSTNGTFLNGKRVTGPTTAQEGDVVAVASFSITLAADGRMQTVDARGRYSIEARQVNVDVPGKRLLEDVSLTIHPGEFVGLMGPSGAGKSTLMNALNGYVAPSGGAVLINGRDLYEQYDMFRGQIGYVPQDDIMHGDLTVGEALYYTARLRLPPDFSDGEIRERIAKVLEQLGLQGTEDTLIGSPEKKGISGGQRKRVNLAMELLTDPSILFLDEPTSGLSSEDALMVMKVLRQVADGGKTILLTIHQPSLPVYRLMDHLVVVAKDAGSDDPGCLAWYGPAYPDAIRFFEPDASGDGAGSSDGEPSPDGVLRGLATDASAHWKRTYRRSRYHEKFVAGRQSSASIPVLPPRKKTRRELGIRQAWTLMRRGLTVRLRDRANTTLLMAQAPYIAVLIMLVFGADAREEVTDETWPSVARATSMTCFLLALSALWCGCSNAVREIVGEWAIYRRERMVNLKIPSYIASKFAVLIGLSALQCLLLLGMVYPTSGLEGPFAPLFGVLLLSAAVGIAIGLVISALSRTSEFAVTMLPVVILPMIMLAGALQPVEEMNGVVRTTSHAVPVRWSFESMLLLETEERPTWTPPAPAGMALDGTSEVAESEPRDMAESFFPEEEHRTSVVTGTGVLLGMLLVLLTFVALLLKHRDVQ